MQLDYEAMLMYVIRGSIGLLLIYGLSNVPARVSTEVERLLSENEKLRKRNRHLSSFSRNLGDANASLQSTLKRAQDRETKIQLTRDRLNGEVVRRGSQIRSLEFELLQERNQARGGR